MVSIHISYSTQNTHGKPANNPQRSQAEKKNKKNKRPSFLSAQCQDSKNHGSSYHLQPHCLKQYASRKLTAKSTKGYGNAPQACLMNWSTCAKRPKVSEGQVKIFLVCI